MRDQHCSILRPRAEGEGIKRIGAVPRFPPRPEGQGDPLCVEVVIEFTTPKRYFPPKRR